MKTVVEKAYAKINLYLEVFLKKEDGYHDIDSIMQTISLHDTVTVTFEPLGNYINMTCNDPKIPCDQSNIAVKCAKAYMDFCNITGTVNIHIDKVIPVSAGLGGGSADGAAVLRALNKLNDTPVSADELCKIGRGVGADIPFCTIGGGVRCGGIGDIFSPASSLDKDLFIVVAKGKMGSDTKQAYKSIDNMTSRVIRNMPTELTSGLEKGDIASICANLYNAFEAVVLPKNTECSSIRRSLSVLGAKASLMSGSGSAVFGIFTDGKKAENAVKFLKNKGHFAGVYHPVDNITED